MGKGKAVTETLTNKLNRLIGEAKNKFSEEAFENLQKRMQGDIANNYYGYRSKNVSVLEDAIKMHDTLNSVAGKEGIIKEKGGEFAQQLDKLNKNGKNYAESVNEIYEDMMANSEIIQKSLDDFAEKFRKDEKIKSKKKKSSNREYTEVWNSMSKDQKDAWKEMKKKQRASYGSDKKNSYTPDFEDKTNRSMTREEYNQKRREEWLKTSEGKKYTKEQRINERNRRQEEYNRRRAEANKERAENSRQQADEYRRQQRQEEVENRETGLIPKIGNWLFGNSKDGSSLIGGRNIRNNATFSFDLKDKKGKIVKKVENASFWNARELNNENYAITGQGKYYSKSE